MLGEKPGMDFYLCFHLGFREMGCEFGAGFWPTRTTTFPYLPGGDPYLTPKTEFAWKSESPALVVMGEDTVLCQTNAGYGVYSSFLY